MQVPEKLALIGGSILLSSTLTFTLKSQASSLIPNVSHSISHVFDHIGDAKDSSDFNTAFSNAHQHGWRTGVWGDARYYIDNDYTLYVGSGRLSGSIRNVLGQDALRLGAINFTQSVKAPQDSSNLLATGSNNLTDIHGMARLDTSDVTNMDSMFASNDNLRTLDLGHVDMAHVTTTSPIYHVPASTFTDGDSNISTIIFGQKTQISNTWAYPPWYYGLINWKNKDTGEIINNSVLIDGHSHPGIWLRQ